MGDNSFLKPRRSCSISINSHICIVSSSCLPVFLSSCHFYQNNSSLPTINLLHQYQNKSTLTTTTHLHQYQNISTLTSIHPVITTPPTTVSTQLLPIQHNLSTGNTTQLLLTALSLLKTYDLSTV